ncbi:uncharacterized protein Z519_07764 [Cladophialophora bantiana CBS 173.52]|uniref:Uncharacterized protein n=1 Tax=Cladophialophora bantiana (strain ATCC 10958 / CBS 173.52 / CDC B-1940 / NIH 8579) TaxID=1442370 RepID=A0A0D2I4H3_CLAB1|nr:uncharacterized protein Z519_07764 [Cladophialophora bantiana CBS 173.52]KIW91794.1 hypothetical protein Z519_07764 [Cladophialophora bantiana CBS 173.52]
MASETVRAQFQPDKTRKTVLITGCSAHGLGHALAIAFHRAGLRVFASARNPDKMAELQALGIECLRLDVLDEESIKLCVETVRGLTRRDGEVEGRLDCLVNNAGGGYNMPVADISIPEAKALFDLNVWSCIAVTQAFLPLLINAAKPDNSAPSSAATTTSKSKASPRHAPSLILNNTSVSSVEPTPHNSAYHASKAASAMFSTHMRIELQPFNIHVIDLKTGCVHSNFHANHQGGNAALPEGSIYAPVKEQTESAMRNAFPIREDPDKWARDVVRDVLRPWQKAATRESTPLPLEIWRGTGAWRTWFYNCTFWPVGWWDEWWRKAVGLDLLREKVRRSYGA